MQAETSFRLAFAFVTSREFKKIYVVDVRNEKIADCRALYISAPRSRARYRERRKRRRGTHRAARKNRIKLFTPGTAQSRRIYRCRTGPGSMPHKLIIRFAFHKQFRIFLWRRVAKNDDGGISNSYDGSIALLGKRIQSPYAEGSRIPIVCA